MKRLVVVAVVAVAAIPAIAIGLTFGPLWWLVTSAWRVIMPPPIEVRVVP